MSQCLNRRQFIGASAAAAAAALGRSSATAQESPPSPHTRPSVIKKAVLWNMLPDGLSVEDRFKLARDVGFEGMEITTLDDPQMVREFGRAADRTGVPVHSILSSAQWRKPLSSSDPAVVQESMANVELSLRNARDLGADAVLIVPGVVTPRDAYKDVYARSTNAIRVLADRAADAKVALAIEDVWNRFLLSPLEFVQFIDQFNSPWVRAYFDIGNVVLYAYPQDWIRTLRHRIVKLHAKDFNRDKFQWTPLLEGSVDWKEVRAALHEVGYCGYLTAELPAGDEAYLREVAVRMGRIIDGKV